MQCVNCEVLGDLNRMGKATLRRRGEGLRILCDTNCLAPRDSCAGIEIEDFPPISSLLPIQATPFPREHDKAALSGAVFFRLRRQRGKMSSFLCGGGNRGEDTHSVETYRCFCSLARKRVAEPCYYKDTGAVGRGVSWAVGKNPHRCLFLLFGARRYGRFDVPALDRFCEPLFVVDF